MIAFECVLKQKAKKLYCFFFQCDVIIEMCKFETCYFSHQKYLSSNFHMKYLYFQISVGNIYVFNFPSEMFIYL